MTGGVAVDPSGTHARFAVADGAAGRVTVLSEALTLETAGHASLQTGKAFAATLGRPAPRSAGTATASPIGGDVVVLTHGARKLVIAIGLGQGMADRLPRSGFASRCVVKERCETMTRSVPVMLIIHPQSGLYGARAAFVRKRRS